MTIPNCIVIDESNQLIKDLKELFPQRTFADLKADVGTFMNQANMFDRFPTLKEMQEYYSSKSTNTTDLEVPIEGAEESTIPAQSIKPEASMYFPYGNNKRADVTANTTFDAIIIGERTATTRYESEHADFWKELKVGDIVPLRNTKDRRDSNKKVIYIRITKAATKLGLNTDEEVWSKKEGWSTDYFNFKVKPRLSEAYQVEYEYVGDNRNAIANKGNTEQLRDVQSEKEYADFSVLDEISNLTFRNAQRKADRVNLIAREFSKVADIIYNQYTQRANSREEEPQKKEVFVASNADKIARIVKDATLNPYLLSEFDSICIDNGINPKKTTERVEFLSTNNNLVEQVLNSDSEARYKFNELQKIQDNWAILLGEAANILYTTEAINLDVVNMKASDSTNQEAENEDDITPDGENSVSLKDGWMVKARELDLRDTLSQETRKILASIKRVDRNGNPDVDDLGMERYLDPDTAHLILLEKISTIESADEFIPALEELANRHPWVNQVLQAIKDDENNSEFATILPKLYTDLRKEFVPYYIQAVDKDGKIITKQVNRSPSIMYLLNRWRDLFEQGTIISDYSVYNKKGEFSKVNAQKGLNVIKDIQSKLNGFSTEQQASDYILSNIERVSKLLNMVGIEFSDDEIISTLSFGESIVENLDALLGNIDTIFSQIIKNDYIAGTDLINELSGAYSEIATLFNTIPQGTIIATFREAGRTRQSYSAPSYMGRIHNGIKNPDSAKALQFIEDNFGKYRQLKDETGYKNYWLSLMTDKTKGQSYRNLLSRKIVVHRDGVEFNDWSEYDYLAVALTEFAASPDDSATGATAYYALPLLADAPSAEFIKFKRITDTEELGLDGKYRNAKDIILDRLAEVAYSEWERMQVVTQRANNNKADAVLKSGEEKVSEIASFDGKAGKRFNFFPSLNNTEFIKSLEGKSKSEILDLLRAAIAEYEEAEFEVFKANYGAFTAILGVSEETLENFFYNNGLAYTQMVQLYTTDLAYYKNLNDFQKRFKEVYAMTNRLYTGFSDISKTRKVVYLKDITFTSPVLRELREALDNAVKNHFIDEISRDYILSQYTKDSKRKLEGVNDTDAQGFVTLDSYKKVMRMTGNWTSEMERAKERFESGAFSIEDFNIIWQTIKPFEFTHTESRSGVLVNVEGQEIPYGKLKVPTQYKNSEYLLMAIFNSIALSQSKSPLLRALNKWMVDNDIDLAQFESGVKTGNQACIDLNNLTTEEEILDVLNGALTNPDTIHESSWEDYGIQSATPEHLVDHDALMGSQAKKLIMADLPKKLTISLKNKTLNREATYTLFQNLLSFGYIEGFEDCVEAFSSIENIAAAIQKEMAGNTRYTDEERKACTLRPDGKDFNVSLYDPIQSSRIQQLLNSILKKRITKQQSTGAACIQVSNVGLTDKLQVRFRDENGDLIFTEDEWLNTDKPSSKKDRSRLDSLRKQYGLSLVGYKEYRDKVKATSMAYMECYLPAYTKKFFSVLGKTEGNFNINDLPEELRKCLGYRIPTEAKYSMQSIYIKGFLPQQNGSAIMLPSEITTIVGSDFDVDKVYLMLPNVKVGSHSEDAAKKDFREFNNDYTVEELEEIFGDDIVEGTDSTKTINFKKWLKKQREEGKYLADEDGMYLGKKDSYLYKPSVNLDKYLTLNADGSIKEFKYKEFYKEVPKYKRDNLILDIFLEVLSSPYLPAQQLKPGGFVAASKQAAIMNIFKNMSVEELVSRFAGTTVVNAKTLRQAFDALNASDPEELKSIASETAPTLNPLNFTTQMYFHSQNANGGKMIGVYAVGNASHSIGEWGKTALKEPFIFLGTQLQVIDNYLGADGSLISENLANFLAASVDNVKDPVLKALNQDTKTGDVTNFLLRAGVPLNAVSLYMTTQINPIDSLGDVETAAIEKAQDLTIDDILMYREGLLGPESNSLVSQALSYLDYKVKKFSRDLTEITQAFRGDAMSSAPGPSIGHNIIRILKLRQLQEDLQSKSFSYTTDLINIDKLLDNTNYDIDSILEDSYAQNCPFVYAATKCGVTGSNEILKKIFPQLQDKLLDLVLDPNFGLSGYLDLTRMKTEEAAKLVDTFYSELMLYLLQGTKYFGEANTKQKNLYYMNEFPQKFLELREKYPLILGTNNLTKNLIVSAKNKGFSRIMFTNSGNLTKSLKETIANDWAMLLATQEQKETREDGTEVVTLSAEDAAEIRNLGFELFKYATNFGLEFSGGKSFIQLAPNILRRAIKDYDRTVRELDRAVNLTPFVTQFIHNHSELAELYPKAKSPKFATDGSFTTTFKSLRYPKVETYKDEESGLRIYEATSEVIKKDNRGNDIFVITFTPMKNLGTVRGFKEYYYGIENPDTVINSTIREGAAEQSDSYATEEMPYVPPIYEEDYDSARDDFDEEYEDPTAHLVYDANGNIVGLC